MVFYQFHRVGDGDTFKASKNLKGIFFDFSDSLGEDECAFNLFVALTNHIEEFDVFSAEITIYNDFFKSCHIDRILENIILEGAWLVKTNDKCVFIFGIFLLFVHNGLLLRSLLDGR